MGTADKEVAGAERTDDLRRTRNQGHHAFGLNIGHLAQRLLPGIDRNQKQDSGRSKLTALRRSAD